MGGKQGIRFFNFWNAFLWPIFCTSVINGLCIGHECYRNENVDDSDPVVVTKTGSIVGKYIKVFNKEVPVFLGIPFAEPPVGKKRFQITKPILSWTGALFAKEKSPACMQYSTRIAEWIPQGLNVSEDCLYLNVWLPPNRCHNRSDKIPVMLWLFSGGYYSGSGMMDVYDGDVLATLGNVIVVTINYRLNVFGFLNLDSKEAPGNQGLYDQYLALKWIHENIQYFGGDPNSVTLFGESAGGISVSLQMISPYPRGLFHKAIMESGNAYQAIEVDYISESIKKAHEFSLLVGCSIESSNLETVKKDILNCLMKRKAEDLVIADNYFSSIYPTYFTPTYGNECQDCLKYILRPPMESMNSGEIDQIPLMIGHNKDEGSLFLVYSLPRIFTRDKKPLLNNSVAKKVLQDFFSIALGSYEESTISFDKIFDYYMDNIVENGSDAPLRAISSICGDNLFGCGNMFFADHVKDAYFYLYTHRSRRDLDDKWIGVPHFAEVPYVFGKPIKDLQNYTSEDRRFSRDIIRIWTSFARYGYPVTKESETQWPKYSASDRKIYELNPIRKRSLKFPSQTVCEEIWNPLFEKIFQLKTDS